MCSFRILIKIDCVTACHFLVIMSTKAVLGVSYQHEAN